MKTTIILFAAVLTGLLSYNCETRSDNNNVYSEWDEDKDDRISSTEFDSYYGEEYFVAWDENGDKVIDTEEWDQGVETHYADEQAQLNFQSFDTSKDNGVDRDEFIRGTWSLWDVDRDGYINEEEFEVWYFKV